MKKQFEQFAPLFGFTCHYSGHTNTMYIKPFTPKFGVEGSDLISTCGKWPFNISLV